MELKRFVNIFYMIIRTYKVNVLFYYFHIHSGGNFVLGAPTFLDPPLQEAHLTPTAPREGQSPDLTNRSQNQGLLGDQGLNPLPGEDQGLDPLPGEDQGLVVLDTAVATDISPGHTLPDHKGDTGTVCTAGLEI